MLLTKAEALRLAKICLDNDDINSVKISSITSLWAGMGKIYKVSAANGAGEFVIKYVDPKVSKNPSIGDKRKLDSYAVESAFYEKYSEELREEGIGLAKFLHVERRERKTVLCLSVLQNAPQHDFFELTLDWLAAFHAATWQKPCAKLQSAGTYWHLDTRPNEWDRMSNHGLEGRLKRAARAIDGWLKESSIQCWVHGDAKDANIMWDGTQIAMCDFQYVGRGSPAKDLAYFLCSSCATEDDALVEFYFAKLISRLQDPPSRRDFHRDLELAYCDYLRFMFGWGVWGSDITQRVKKTMDGIDGGKDLGSDLAYQQALQRWYDACTERTSEV